MNRGAFAIIVKNDEVLLVRSLTVPRFVDSWSLPGGIVEYGESLQNAAKRESIEETGIVCQIGELLSEVSNVASNIQVSIFRATYISGQIVKDDVEIAEAKWFKLTDAIDLPLAYNTKDILNALLA